MARLKSLHFHVVVSLAVDFYFFFSIVVRCSVVLIPFSFLFKHYWNFTMVHYYIIFAKYLCRRYQTMSCLSLFHFFLLLFFIHINMMVHYKIIFLFFFFFYYSLLFLFIFSSSFFVLLLMDDGYWCGDECLCWCLPPLSYLSRTKSSIWTSSSSRGR